MNSVNTKKKKKNKKKKNRYLKQWIQGLYFFTYGDLWNPFLNFMSNIGSSRGIRIVLNLLYFFTWLVGIQPLLQCNLKHFKAVFGDILCLVFAWA